MTISTTLGLCAAALATAALAKKAAEAQQPKPRTIPVKVKD